MPYSPCVDGELLESSVYDVALQNKELDIPYMIGYTSEDIAPDQMKQAAVNWSLLLERQGRCPAMYIALAAIYLAKICLLPKVVLVI